MFTIGSRFITSKYTPPLTGVTVTDWSILNTGLSTAHTIGKPSEGPIQIGNDRYTHFSLTGDTQKILRLNIDNLTFSSSSANVNSTVTPTPQPTLNTELSAYTYYGSVFGIFRSEDVSGFVDRVYSSTDGYSYTNIGPSSPLLDSTLVGLYPSESDSRIITATTSGLFYISQSGAALSGAYDGANSTFSLFSDCRTVASNGTKYFLAGGTLGGGVEHESKILSIDASSLVNSFTAWNIVSHNFGEPITKLSIVNVFLDWTPYAQVPNSFRVSGSSTKIILVGGINGKIGRSVDGGSTWSNAATQPFSTGDSVVGFVSAGVNIFAATSTGKLAVSQNGGQNWTLINIGSSISSITEISICLNGYYISGGGAFLARREAESLISS